MSLDEKITHLSKSVRELEAIVSKLHSSGLTEIVEEINELKTGLESLGAEIFAEAEKKARADIKAARGE